jgi:putative aminopeptidase FrvX
MDKIETFLHAMLSAPGISGFEKPVSDIIAEFWRPLTDQLSESALGSLHGLRKAASPSPRPSLMIAAHMDGIGLMVKDIRQGYLFITQIGGVDARILPGQLVTVHGKQEIPGIVQMIPDRFLPDSSSGKPPVYNNLFIDTGLSENILKRDVHVGDIVSFASQPLDLNGGYVSGHSLDNRASVAAVTVCLEELKHFNLQWDLWCAATVQEEMHLIGAATSTFQLQPTLGIAVDVTFAWEPSVKDYTSFPLGKGPTIGLGANVHPALHEKFVEIAKEIDLPYAIETMPRSSGTDAMSMQITAAGVPTMVIGIPIRYMHTPYELTAMTDIRRAGRLLARFIMSLEADSYAALIKKEVL